MIYEIEKSLLERAMRMHRVSESREWFLAIAMGIIINAIIIFVSPKGNSKQNTPFFIAHRFICIKRIIHSLFHWVFIVVWKCVVCLAIMGK